MLVGLVLRSVPELGGLSSRLRPMLLKLLNNGVTRAGDVSEENENGCANIIDPGKQVESGQTASLPCIDGEIGTELIPAKRNNKEG